MDLLLKVIRHDADSAQAQIAQTQVLRIAERYETTGLRRLAIDALERLERAGPDVADAPNRRFLDREDSGKGSSGGRGGNAPAADGSDDGSGLYPRLRRGAG